MIDYTVSKGLKVEGIDMIYQMAAFVQYAG